MDTPAKVVNADTNSTGNAGVGPANKVEGGTRFSLPNTEHQQRSSQMKLHWKVMFNTVGGIAIALLLLALFNLVGEMLK